MEAKIAGRPAMLAVAERPGQQGFVLITVLFLLILFTGIGLAMFASISATVKSAGQLRKDTIRYYEADGGSLSVFGYMTAYKRTVVPQEVKHTASFDVSTRLLSQSVRYPPGFSTLWKGADVKARSRSKDGKAEIEAIAFIPTSPAGYGNE